MTKRRTTMPENQETITMKHLSTFFAMLLCTAFCLLVCTSCDAKREEDNHDNPTNVLQENIELSNGTPAVRSSTVYAKAEDIKYTVEIKTENRALVSFMIAVSIPDEEASKDMLDVSEDEWQNLFLEGMNNVMPL